MTEAIDTHDYCQAIFASKGETNDTMARDIK